MDTYAHLEKRWQAALDRNDQQRLIALFEAVIKNAIHARSPKKRPSGKAGLKAEKGYYRLLYLEDHFQQEVNALPATDGEPTRFEWNRMAVILGQMQDIPELQSEIMTEIALGLTEIEAAIG